jgi:hypothetical protein
MSIAAAQAALEAMLAESATELVRSWRHGRRTLGELLADPDEAAFVAGRIGVALHAPLDLADMTVLAPILDAKVRWENRGWLLPSEVVNMAAAKAIAAFPALRGHEVAE